MKFKLFIILLVVALFLPCFIYGNVPVSRQALFVEAPSATEVTLNATGEYTGQGNNARNRKRDVERNGVDKATEDALKAAVYFVLFSGTDPIITSADERRRFEMRENQFFEMSNINRFITYTDSRIQNRTSTKSGEGIRLSRIVRVDVERITRDLEEQRIIESRANIMAAVGFPMIMVIPETKPGQNPIEVLRTDALMRHAASVVESHLTQQRFEVIVPQQLEQLNSLNEIQLMLDNANDDIAYSMALSIGSDVYITFAGLYEDAGFNTRRYAMTVRAFETTTARLLGTETGYSQGRQGEASISVEEAINAALTNVLSRVMNYWQQDMQQGIQYKIVVNIDPSFSGRDVDDIQDAFMDAVSSVSRRYREVIATRQTLDYLVWADVQRFPNSRTLFRDIRTSFEDTAWGARLTTVNINRKMILLRID